MERVIRARFLVGESVYEGGTLTVRDGWLHVEFDAEDLDSISLDLFVLRRAGLLTPPTSDS